jgi:hypothetical protein
MTVFVEGDSRYRSLAEEIAADRDEAAVSDFQFVDDGPVLYVATPREIREETIVKLTERLQRKGPSEGAFGVITGYDVDSARSLYYRDRSSGGQHCVFSNFQDVDWHSADDDLSVLSGDDATVGELERLTESGLSSLSLLAEGRSIHLKATDGFICGFPSVERDFEGRQPFCVDGDARDCPYPGELLPADELDPTHAFVDSCVSVLPGNDFESLPVHVGLRLLENVTTMIGTYRPGVSVIQECVLNEALLRDGRSAAERCYLLNENSSALAMGELPYLVFGKPEVRVRDPKQSSYETDVSTGGSAVTLDLHDVRTSLVDVRIPGDSLPADADRFFVRNLADSRPETPLFFSAFRESDAVRVLIYAAERIEADHLRFEVATTPGKHADQRRIADRVSNLRKLQRLNLTEDTLDGLLDEASTHLRSLPSDVEVETYDVDAYRKKSQRITQLNATLEKARDKLVSQLENRYLPLLHSDYEPSVVQTDSARASFDCPYCTRTPFTRTGTNVHGDRRTQCTCPMCGFVFDVPGGTDDAIPYPQIRGDLVNVDADELSFEVRFRNTSDSPSAVTFYPWIGSEYDDYRGSDHFEEKTRTKEIPPNEVGAATFTVDLSTFTPNEYMLTAFVIDEMELYHGIRKLIVGEKMGHVLGTRLD